MMLSICSEYWLTSTDNDSGQNLSHVSHSLSLEQWHSALSRNGFSGVDMSLGDYDEGKCTKTLSSFNHCLSITAPRRHLLGRKLLGDSFGSVCSASEVLISGIILRLDGFLSFAFFSRELSAGIILPLQKAMLTPNLADNTQDYVLLSTAVGNPTSASRPKITMIQPAS